jgi:WD40 repeat protein
MTLSSLSLSLLILLTYFPQGNTWDGSLVLVNKETSQYLETTTSSGIEIVRISKENSIVKGGDDGCLTLYDSSLKLLSNVSGHDDIVSALFTSSNSSQTISGAFDGSCALWDSGDGHMNLIQTFPAHTGPINDFSQFPESPSLCCSVGQDGFLRIWDFRTSTSSESTNRNCVSIASLNQIGSSCVWSTFNSSLIVCGLEDGAIQFYDIRSPSTDSTANQSPIQLQYLHTQQPYHSGRINALLTSSSSDGYFTASSEGLLLYVLSSTPSSEYRKWYVTYPFSIPPFFILYL